MVYKTSEKDLKVRITKKDSVTGEDTKYYENSYMWNDQF